MNWLLYTAYKTKHCVSFFTPTCKTKHTRDGSVLLQDHKKVSISISFQTRVEIFPQYSISKGGARIFWVEKIEKLIREGGRLLGTQQ